MPQSCVVGCSNRAEKRAPKKTYETCFDRFPSKETRSVPITCSLSASRGTHSFCTMRAEYAQNILGVFYVQ